MDTYPRINYFNGKYRFLSNFYEARVYLDREEYPTVEHAYQAAKTLIPEERAKIRACSKPGEAKRLGKTITLRSDWNQVKLSVMTQLVAQKFCIHGDLAMKLLHTGDAYLEEGNNWGDTYWGTVNGKGENHLGRILMDVRDMLRVSPWSFGESELG